MKQGLTTKKPLFALALGGTITTSGNISLACDSYCSGADYYACHFYPLAGDCVCRVIKNDPKCKHTDAPQLSSSGSAAECSDINFNYYSDSKSIFAQ